MLAHLLAQDLDPLEEFTKDPILTVACVMLIVVSLGWIVISRLIVHNVKKAQKKAKNPTKKGEVKPARDVWKAPP